MTHPTDALRLVRYLAAKGANTPGCNNWRSASMCRQIVEVLDKVAPASTLPGGGQCSGISGELDPRLVEWGYTSLDEAITHLGKLLDDQTAFDGLGDLIAELKAGKAAVEELLYAHTDKSIAMGEAFLARNGTADLQKMQNSAPRNAPRGLRDEC